MNPSLYVTTAVVTQPSEWIQVRAYAKKTNNKKKNVASSTGNDTTEPSAMLFDEKAIEVKFNHVIHTLQEQFNTLRVGRANPALLDTVRVNIEDTNFPLRDLAQVTIRDPQTLLVSVHDTEYQTAVDKSIREAGLNLNPVIDSKFIRVPIPKPTKESREKMAKVASQTAEQIKSRVRLVRQDGMKQLKTDAKTQSKDDIKKMEKLVQTLTDKYNKQVDDMLKSKLKEIQS
ncbi:ribosome recycling factor domain-containing protein [Halteromyces radiatus]|uniref:ribosome recycling factor domain-containing protein n=1 Tax=Halteromyces radiatus TaxID=101107 RepID=UPI00221E38D6|nr:ribosome recycling factor domain-containing protein [Halteromyces radiatus]KAI8079957.1 ribosome recycling factor domain-containing protein [Halteromyces radiatus]